MQVKVVAHNPDWRRDFEMEAGRLTGALEGCVVSIHHIGSTAISEIFAKPIIDILLTVGDIGRLDARSSIMESQSYEVMGEYGIPGRRFFRKSNDLGIRTHHVHAYQAEHRDIERHLAFRDYMVANPVEAQAYSALKQKLAREYPDNIDSYMDGKDLFIKEHEVKAIAWQRSRVK